MIYSNIVKLVTRQQILFIFFAFDVEGFFAHKSQLQQTSKCTDKSYKRLNTIGEDQREVGGQKNGPTLIQIQWFKKIPNILLLQPLECEVFCLLFSVLYHYELETLGLWSKQEFEDGNVRTFLYFLTLFMPLSA